MKRYFASRPHLAQIAGNVGWLSLDQLVRLSFGLLIGVLVARYLGPSQFGALNYAIAFVSLIGSFATLGLQGVVVRELVLQPSKASAVLGASLLLQFSAATLASVICMLAVRWVNSNDDSMIALVTILALTLPFQCSATVRYCFEAQVLSRYVVWVENVAFAVIFFVKLALLAMQAPLLSFAWVMFCQSLLTAAALAIVYFHRFGRSMKWQSHSAECLRLLRHCWPLALSSIAIVIYTRTDQIMLEHMSDTASVGAYAASLKLCEVWYVLPAIITASLFPSMLALRAANSHLYEVRFFRLLRILVAAAVAGAIFVSFSANFLIGVLFGSAFDSSVDILRVQMWSGVFVFLGVASGTWLIAEGLEIHSFYRTATGACVNVAANWVLIPFYGALGAAIATLFSQVVATYFMDSLSPATRPMFRTKSKALLFFWKW